VCSKKALVKIEDCTFSLAKVTCIAGEKKAKFPAYQSVGHV
jgi:hypothetical protein